MAASVAPSVAASTSATSDPRDDKRRVDAGIERVQDDLADTSADLARTAAALERTQRAIPVAQARLVATQATERAASQRHDTLLTALEVARASQSRAEERLTRTNRVIRDARARIATFAAQMYQDQGLGQLSVALESTSPDDFATRIAMTDTVLDVQAQNLGRLAAEQASANAQRAHLSALREEVARAEAQAAQALAEAAVARGAAAAAKTELDGLAVTQAAQTKALTARQAAERTKLAAMQAESDRLAAVLRARALAAKRAAAAREAAARAAARRAGRVYTAPRESSGGGFLSAPSGAGVSSEFGLRWHPILHYWRLHAGRDYAGACGSPVRAAASGTVISAGWGGGYGNRIVLDHGIHRGVDLTTTYNHMSRYAVRGGHVQRGQVIGYVGTTGLSTGCHLHFETRQDGTPVDPRRWL
jgi:murein DD-endopeptidase MepM/ murein hydrolase activator NlpD